MRHSTSLRGVQDDRGNPGRAFVARPTVNAPGLEHRPPGGVGAASRDTDWTRVRSAGQERPERDDPRHPTAFGHVEERLGVGAPPLMWLAAAKQEQAVAAIPGRAGEELTPRPMDVAALVRPQPHL